MAGGVPDFKHTKSQIENFQKVRLRDIAFLRSFLQTCDLDAAGEANKVGKHQRYKIIGKMVGLVYYRSRDRSGMPTKPPTSMKEILVQGEFWLKKLDENEDLVRELEPPKAVAA